MAGPKAQPNAYRFSSKEYHSPSQLVYYLYRFYDANLQRWQNRDPIGEKGGINLYGFVRNDAITSTDPYGLRNWPYGGGELCMSKNCEKKKCPGQYLGEDDWTKGFQDDLQPGKCVEADAVTLPDGTYLKIPDNCKVTLECDKNGAYKGMKTDCAWARGKPKPSPAPVPPFPPSPYPKPGSKAAEK